MLIILTFKQFLLKISELKPFCIKGSYASIEDLIQASANANFCGLYTSILEKMNEHIVILVSAEIVDSKVKWTNS